VSEQILNLTSAQLGYTVAFTTVYAGKYGEKTNQKQTLLKLPRKSKQHKTQQKNYTGSVAFYDTRPGNRVGLFYTWGTSVNNLHPFLAHHSTSTTLCSEKKHPLTFSFISPIVISGFKQKLQ